MSPLRLFTAFHGNLDFSALPERDRATVIARCYWPLLSLPERLGIPIGFEMTGRTLAMLDAEDPDWVKRFRGLAESGLIEPIASGRAQVVAPLVPAEINRLNLRFGAELYRRHLGFVPETYFVNEQTWSDGLADHYCEAGARRVIMEWNNPAARNPDLRRLRCRPVALATSSDRDLELLWNDSIVFQKVQRAAHGEIHPGELFDYLLKLSGEGAGGSVCVYGGDVEIFDYRPSRSQAMGGAGGETEMTRLLGIFQALAQNPDFEFVLPRDVADAQERLPQVSLGSVPDPIPCKKQPRYNPTRWAVSGRDGIGMNTSCHELLRRERAGARLSRGKTGGLDLRELVDLWGSDFRTRATEEKILAFNSGVGRASEKSRAHLDSIVPPLADGEDILLVNPGADAWEGMPIEVPLRLPAGRVFALRVRVRRGGELEEGRYQVEVRGRHRDGSLRDVMLVLEPQVPGRSEMVLQLVPVTPADSESSTGEGAIEEWRTEAVSARFTPLRGGALESLVFPDVSASPLCGRVPHGYFDEMAYTPDFYTGNVVAVSDRNEKRSDLVQTRLELRSDSCGPVRQTLACELESPMGTWRKIYRLYGNTPRIDVVHDLAFYEARLASLRLGVVTLLPDGWDRDSLRYGTVNGGTQVEWRPLSTGVPVTQSRAVSSAVSATSCLGATEGWVALADGEKGIVVSGNRAEAAVAPMLDFENVDRRFFCRLSHSAAESDETRATFVRGRRSFSFSIEGYSSSDEGVLGRARVRHSGLVYRTHKEVGITNGL